MLTAQSKETRFRVGAMFGRRSMSRSRIRLHFSRQLGAGRIEWLYVEVDTNVIAGIS
jgi:hypothetical protein